MSLWGNILKFDKFLWMLLMCCFPCCFPCCGRGGDGKGNADENKDGEITIVPLALANPAAAPVAVEAVKSTPEPTKGPPQALIPVVAAIPSAVAATSSGENAVSATWKPCGEAAPVTGYKIQYKKSPDGTWVDAPDVAGDVSSTIITGLEPGTTYAVRVAAVNSAGQSPYSGEAKASTDAHNDPADAPLTPTATGKGETTISASWNKPNDNGGAITSYKVQYKKSPGGAWVDAPDVAGGDTLRTNITGLEPGTTYAVRVAAVNSEGVSPYSGEAEANTDEHNAVADAPNKPHVIGNGENSVAASWNKPNDNGGAITGYKVQYKKSPDGAWVDAPDVAGGDSLSSDIIGLEPGTTYAVHVAAVDPEGTSPFSGEAEATTEEHNAVADAPNTPTATSTGETAISASWNKPNDNGGAITSYKVQYKKSPGGAWVDAPDVAGGDSLSSDIIGLEPGTTYAVRVAAVDSEGMSPYSGEAEASTDAHNAPADAPLVPTATGKGETAISASWNKPNDNGGAITSYLVQYKKTSDNEWSAAPAIEGGDTLSADIIGLNPGTTYAVRVAAVDDEGISPFSGEGRATTDEHLEIADAPATPTATGSGEHSVAASWNKPNDNGGGITGYKVQYKKSPDGTWVDAPDVAGGGTLNTDIIGLKPGTAYAVHVAAVDTEGVSPFSGEAVASTIEHNAVADAPAAPIAKDDGETTIAASWNKPNDNGGAITSYKVQYKKSPGGAWVDAPDVAGGDTLRTNITGLEPGTTYAVRVAAVDPEGQSPFSPESIASTATPPPPNAPKITSSTATPLTLNFKWSSGDGGPTTGYKAQYKKADEADWHTVNFPATSADATFKSLPSNTDHEFRVKAIGPGGESDWTSGQITTHMSTRDRLIWCDNKLKEEIDGSCPDVDVDVEKMKILLKEEINFEGGKAIIKEEDMSIQHQLEKTVVTLQSILEKKGFDKFHIRFDGHVHPTGKDMKCLVISYFRAAELVRRCVKAGCDPEFLHAYGFGQRMPVTSEKKRSDENRRVEINFLTFEQAVTIDEDARTLWSQIETTKEFKKFISDEGNYGDDTTDERLEMYAPPGPR